MKKSGPLLLVISLVILTSPVSYARRRESGGGGMRTVELPADYSTDLQLASDGRPAILRGRPVIVGTPLNELGQEVFESLAGNSAVSTLGLPFRWSMTLVAGDAINAYSTAGGQVYVDEGLARLLGTNRGLWAAVLSHELAHSALRHQVRMYLQQLFIAQQVQYFRWRARNGDKAAGWALLGFQIAPPIALKKLAREQEHQADIQGMMLMAGSGYHPDYVFALHNMLQLTTGEQSKFAAFFSDHPRWATRDQRSDRAYAEGLARYNELWVDPASSPGGLPPTVAFLGEPRSVENKRSKTADISIPLYCRNASEPLTLLIEFSHDKRDVPGSLPEFRNSSGNLEVRQSIECSDKEEALPVEIHVPAAALVGRDRKMKAMAVVVGPSSSLLDVSKGFEVRIPKP